MVRMMNAIKKHRVHKAILGRAERIDFPEMGIFGVPAKIDTGAYRTAVWASDIREENGYLKFKLFGPSSEYYTGQDYSAKKFRTVEVESSFGHKEHRYALKMQVQIGRDREITTDVTLADRSKKPYPILVGRKLLCGRYLVDVSEGEPIKDELAVIE